MLGTLHALSSQYVKHYIKHDYTRLEIFKESEIAIYKLSTGDVTKSMSSNKAMRQDVPFFLLTQQGKVQ